MHLLQRNRVDRQCHLPAVQGNRAMAASPVGTATNLGKASSPRNLGWGRRAMSPQSSWNKVSFQIAQSHPLKRSSQAHFRVDLSRASVASGGKYSPASRLCQYLVLRAVRSAICSCVIPAPTRIAETFRPNRVRIRHGAGFFDDMSGIVSKMNPPQHERLPRLVIRCKI